MPLNFKKLLGCPMHNIFHRNRETEKKKGKSDENTESVIDELELINANYSEDPDLILMRKTIDRNPELFILNNLMMCVQFFHNFEEEIVEIRQKLVSVKEPSFNESLLPQKRALLPDVLQEHVGQNLKFTSARQTLRPTLEPLQPIRVYIVHENFEIAEQNDVHHYSTMDDVTTYNLLLKPSDHKGYVYLQHLESYVKKRTTEEELSLIEEKSDTVFENNLLDQKTINDPTKSYSSQSLPEFLNLEAEKSPEEGNSRKRLNLKTPVVVKQRAAIESPASSTSSGYNTSNDSDFGYSGSSTLKELFKSAEIPSSCFKMITYAQSGKVYDPREDKRGNLTSKQKRIKDELRRYNYNVWYIHSPNFMRYFFKLFKQNLARVLNFDDAAVSDVRIFNSVIYCDKIDVLGSSLYTKIEPYEIIPCVWSQWPDCAQEWFVRERGTWPNFEVMQKIKEFGCYIVPESFVPRQESNPMKKIEWQLNFPAAEKYLETQMNHAQTRVLLIALMLHKTFVRPVDTLLGLTTTHIRNKLFWLIEQGALTWLEHRTGECLLKLLTGIYQNISQNPPLLKDYFMKEKNLFQNIPNECLLQSQKQINRILTNPVMYLIYAIENIHFKQRFFPRLDCDELLRILTLDLVPLVNPQIVENHRRSNSRVSSMHHVRSNASTRYWEDKYDFTVTRSSVTNKTLINTRAIMKNPIIEISVRCQEMENTRLSILLDFFIRHFIRTAQRYHQYGALKLKSTYISHVERLCILLSEKDGCAQGNVRVYMKKVNVLKNHLIKVQPGQEPPETPQRNTDQPVFNKPLNERFVLNSEFVGHTIDESAEVQMYTSCTDLTNSKSEVVTSPETLQLRGFKKSTSVECFTFDVTDQDGSEDVIDDTRI